VPGLALAPGLVLERVRELVLAPGLRN